MEHPWKTTGLRSHGPRLPPLQAPPRPATALFILPGLALPFSRLPIPIWKSEFPGVPRASVELRDIRLPRFQHPCSDNHLIPSFHPFYSSSPYSPSMEPPSLLTLLRFHGPSLQPVVRVLSFVPSLFFHHNASSWIHPPVCLLPVSHWAEGVKNLRTATICIHDLQLTESSPLLTPYVSLALSFLYYAALPLDCLPSMKISELTISQSLSAEVGQLLLHALIKTNAYIKLMLSTVRWIYTQ